MGDKERPNKPIRLTESFKYAAEGILYAVKTERNMKIHLGAAFLVLLFSLFCKLSWIQLIAIVMVISLVIICEMFNTAIEKIVDMVSPKYHPLAKCAKDVAAGAVFIASANAVVIGYLVFAERLVPITERIIDQIKQSPTHISFAALFIILCVVVALKLLMNPKQVIQGGMPSGHSAIALSIVTAIFVLSKNALVTILAFVLGGVVVQSRLEAKIHSLPEVLIGGVLGASITFIIFKLFGF